MALKKFLTFCKSRKIITFAHLNCINVNDNIKDNFMRGKVNNMVSKVKTLSICALELKSKWIHEDVILSRENDSHDATPHFNQHWSY